MPGSLPIPAGVARTLVRRLQGGLDRLVPSEVGDDASDERRRARIGVLLSALMMAGAVVGTLLQLILGTVTQILVVNGAMTLAAIGGCGVLWHTRSPAAMAGWMGAFSFAGLVAVIVLTAGLAVLPFLSLAMLPGCTAFIAGTRQGAFWAGLCTVFFAGLTAMLALGLTPTLAPSPSNVIGNQIFGALLVAWGGVALAAGFDRQSREAMRILDVARQEAEAASLAKGRFLAHMSHEIRTPLGGVLGVTELLLDTSLNAGQRELAETAHRSAQALLDIVNDVLDLSKIEAGRMELEHTEFALPAVLDTVGAILRGRAAERKIAFEIERSSDVPTRLRGDPVRLRQVLLNLAGNAIKFTERGSVRIRIDRDPASGRDHVRFDICDTGIGIAPERIPDMFRDFVQADASTTRRYGGTGLGLTISQHLAGLMGGRIRVQSQPGKGSVFYFSIPLPPVLEAEKGEEMRGRPDRTGTAPYPGARVLVVDDDSVNRLVARRMLEKLGCRVDVAEHGRAALEQLAGQRYDLVFMDCQMPDLDGFAATRELRRREAPGARTPVVALTANVLAGERERCLAAGMDDYLSKPVTRRALEEKVGAFLAPGTTTSATAHRV